MNPILHNLKQIAPDVAFNIKRERDEYFVWNGDGPDPIDEGFDPYDVDVTAEAIVMGEIKQGTASLGGSYFKPQEDFGDIHGYLPQMLVEAATELLEQVPDGLKPQLTAAIDYVTVRMREQARAAAGGS